jgi:tetratricopeptide (TPR) repeat protein
MNKRLDVLEKITSTGQGDSFAWYALGMEYRKEGRTADALAAFQTLRERDATYLPVYLMAGQLLRGAGDKERATEWLRAGIELARTKADGKALGELEGELAAAESD